MNGTPKQVSWALSIKSEKHINAMCDALVKRFYKEDAMFLLSLKEEDLDTALEKINNFKCYLLNNETAVFWIDVRQYFNCHSENYKDVKFRDALELFTRYLEGDI